MMHSGWKRVTDLGLGVLRARGADAVPFLQGQLSNDVARAPSGQWQLNGYHTPQGRVIALLRLMRLAADEVLALVPLGLIPPVIARLNRYVLRSKVQLSDDSAQWQLVGCAGAASGLPGSARSLRYDATRQLALIPQADAYEVKADGTRDDWVAADIAAGLPQVYLPTSELFVAQMLNLDLTGGIALDKGCYTGQEIIARAHYRGQVKRRMQRFESEQPCELLAGASGTLADGRNFKVVAAVVRGDGRSEFLAVAPAALGQEEPESPPDPSRSVLAVRPLPLPYALPLA